MPKFLRKKHFIITRFNYPAEYEHLEERVRLFNQFTLPSIKAQTDQDFEFIIIGKPPIDLPKNGRFIDEQIPGGKGKCMYMAYIIAACKENVDLILMTRLDNDDFLMPTYVEDMKAAANRARIYEFKGYRLDLRNGAFYIDTRHKANVTSPFITLAQTPKNLKSVYSHNHGHMWRYFPLTMLPKRNWCQVIHDTNWVLNRGGVADTAKRGILTEDIPEFVQKLL